MNNYIFFLGGHDGEMLAIREILDQQQIKYHDKNLLWHNAKSSAYIIELNQLADYRIPVLIELTIDTPIPSNAIIIDHHNKDEKKKSSIEQTAELIGIELNRRQKLIAANDRGYIPAMECMCATKNEIKETREYDRRAQGVTEEDERLAVESIKENKTEENDITIIKAKTEKFSPITDRMYGNFNRLIIYNDEQLVHYGAGKQGLIEKYSEFIQIKKVYYGGGEKGFFGFAKGKFTLEDINEIKKEIIHMPVNEKIFSHHIFLFPFKWRKWNVDDETCLKEKLNIKFFTNELLKNEKWKREPLKLNYGDIYNEFNYFYDYVKEVLYDLDKDLSFIGADEDLIHHFEYQIDKKQKYNIKLLGDGSVYNLDIDGILLNVYKTGTAILSFHLRNHNYADKDDILKINKFGRRLYIPFYDLESNSIYTGEKDKTPKEQLLCGTKRFEVPDAIWIGNINQNEDDKNLYEDFEKYRKIENIKYGTFLLPKFIEGLFPPLFLFEQERKGFKDDGGKEKDKDYKINICPVLDDRMHVVCWYGNTKLVNTLNQIEKGRDIDIGEYSLKDNRERKKYYSFETSDWWYSYIFIDTSPMHTDKFVKQNLLKEQTYTRWVGYGTLYGISRFSFVALTTNFSDLENYGSSFLVRHLQTIYYKMAELCLLQRATVLSFSDEVTHVSNLIVAKEDLEKIEKKIEELYKFYIMFVNKIYFREITAQEQGIEIYEMLQKIMRIPGDVKNLDSEIDELNRFASIIAEKTETKAIKAQENEAHKLTRLATLFIIPTIFAGILGMNVLPAFDSIPKFLFSWQPVWPFWISITLILLITVIGQHLIRNFWLKDSKSSKKRDINE